MSNFLLLFITLSGKVCHSKISKFISCSHTFVLLRKRLFVSAFHYQQKVISFMKIYFRKNLKNKTLNFIPTTIF